VLKNSSHTSTVQQAGDVGSLQDNLLFWVHKGWESGAEGGMRWLRLVTTWASAQEKSTGLFAFFSVLCPVLTSQAFMFIHLYSEDVPYIAQVLQDLIC